MTAARQRPPIEACFDAARIDFHSRVATRSASLARRAVSLLALAIYAPLGTVLAAARLLLQGPWAVLFRFILPRVVGSRGKLRAARVFCALCGIDVRIGGNVAALQALARGSEARDCAGAADDFPPVIVSNHVHDMDAAMARALADAVILTRLTLPRWMLWLMEMIRVEGVDRDARARARTRIERTLRRDRRPLLVFPEGGTTNGRAALLRYERFVFSLDRPIVPLAVRLSGPGLDWFHLEHLGVPPTFAHMLLQQFWFYFAPYKRYDVTVLDPQRRRAGEEPEDFARRVQVLTAETLGIFPSDYTYADKAALVRRTRPPRAKL